MPGMTGIEICKKLRLLPERKYRYVLLLTSRGTKEEVIEGLEAGADDYLVKPISPPEIQARLRSAQRILQLQDRLTAECRIVLEEKHRIRLLLDSTAEGILGVDRTGRCTFCNRAALAEFGYDSESQILGKDIHSAVHHTRPDGTPCPNEECRFFSALLKQQPAHFTDEHYCRQDGSQFPVETWSYLTWGEDGEVGAMLTFWNTTDRRNAEDAQRQSEQLFKAMAENSADLIRVVDPQGRMIYSNPAHLPVLGLTPAELQRTVIFDHVHPDDRQEARQMFEEASSRESGQPLSFACGGRTARTSPWIPTAATSATPGEKWRQSCFRRGTWDSEDQSNRSRSYWPSANSQPGSRMKSTPLSSLSLTTSCYFVKRSINLSPRWISVAPTGQEQLCPSTIALVLVRLGVDLQRNPQGYFPVTGRASAHQQNRGRHAHSFLLGG
jgi:PAS domain S-box-containing protein